MSTNYLIMTYGDNIHFPDLEGLHYKINCKQFKNFNRCYLKYENGHIVIFRFYETYYTVQRKYKH